MISLTKSIIVSSLGAYPMWYVVQKWTKKQAGRSPVFIELASEVDFHNLR